MAFLHATIGGWPVAGGAERRAAHRKRQALAGPVAALALLAALVSSGCGAARASATAGATPARGAASATGLRHTAGAPKPSQSAPTSHRAPAVHSTYTYEIALDDAVPNRHSEVGLVRLTRAGTALHGQLQLFRLLPGSGGVVDPKRTSWPVQGSIGPGSQVRLDVRRPGGQSGCVLFPCRVRGTLTPDRLALQPAANDGAAVRPVDLTPGSLASFDDRVTAIMAFINGYNDYVVGQRIMAARAKGAGSG